MTPPDSGEELGWARRSPAKAGVPLGNLLTVLNRKLEAYLDRDHQIGHRYLMNLQNGAG